MYLVESRRLSIIFMTILLFSGCSSSVGDSKNEIIKYYSSSVPNQTVAIDGEPHNVSYEEYNHSPAHLYFRKSLSPLRITCGTISYFSYIIHCDSDFGDCAFGEEYVSWQMDENTFELEKMRVSSVFSNFTKKGTVLSSNLFFTQSFVAIYNDDSEFSYALLEEDFCTITYIYFFNVMNRDNLVFDEQYKPSNMLYDSDFSGEIIRGSYNMYVKVSGYDKFQS